MKNIAIIPARSGSKGLKDKNIKELLGKPLLAYSIEAAQKSELFDEVMVSTDSEDYASIAKEYGANVPFLRSEENSSDRATSWDMVREVLDKYRELNQSFDTVCLLQPTSPLRTMDDIISAYDIYIKNNAKSVIGVCETEHSPLWENVLPDDNSMDNFIKKENSQRRQELPTFYRINGAIYIVDVKSVIENEEIYKNSFAYIMQREKSIDIDTELDFVMAESIMEFLKKNNSVI